MASAAGWLAAVVTSRDRWKVEEAAPQRQVQGSPVHCSRSSGSADWGAGTAADNRLAPGNVKPAAKHIGD